MVIRLLAETLLYYIACHLVARSHEDAPSFLRVLITVLIVAFVSSAGTAMIDSIWVNNILIGFIAFIILLIGLKVGPFRAIIAALIVMLLRYLMERAFGGGGVASQWMS